jgi:membrane protease subunit (stomatin/prohibitin family)
VGLGAGVALGQTLAQTLGQGLAGVGTAAPAPAASKPDDIVALLEKLGDLKAKGILTDEEFAAKKADLLKKLG